LFWADIRGYDVSVECLICGEGGGASISIRHPSRTFPSGVLGVRGCGQKSAINPKWGRVVVLKI